MIIYFLRWYGLGKDTDRDACVAPVPPGGSGGRAIVREISLWVVGVSEFEVQGYIRSSEETAPLPFPP